MRRLVNHAAVARLKSLAGWVGSGRRRLRLLSCNFERPVMFCLANLADRPASVVEARERGVFSCQSSPADMIAQPLVSGESRT